MKKGLWGVVLSVFLMPFVSAQFLGGGGYFSIGRFFDSVDPQTLILGALFLIFLAVLHQLVFMRLFHENRGLSGVVSLLVSLLMVYGIYRSGMRIDNLFYNLGLSPDALYIILPIVLLAVSILIIWKLGVGGFLTIFGILLISLTILTDIFYAANIALILGLFLLLIGLVLLRRRSRGGGGFGRRGPRERRERRPRRERRERRPRRERGGRGGGGDTLPGAENPGGGRDRSSRRNRNAAHRENRRREKEAERERKRAERNRGRNSGRGRRRRGRNTTLPGAEGTGGSTGSPRSRRRRKSFRYDPEAQARQMGKIKGKVRRYTTPEGRIAASNKKIAKTRRKNIKQIRWDKAQGKKFEAEDGKWKGRGGRMASRANRFRNTRQRRKEGWKEARTAAGDVGRGVKAAHKGMARDARAVDRGMKRMSRAATPKIEAATGYVGRKGRNAGRRIRESRPVDERLTRRQYKRLAKRNAQISDQAGGIPKRGSAQARARNENIQQMKGIESKYDEKGWKRGAKQLSSSMADLSNQASEINRQISALQQGRSSPANESKIGQLRRQNKSLEKQYNSLKRKYGRTYS
jgi:hypothetical protein